MEYSFLGNTGLKISRIGFGNWITSDKEEHEGRTTIHMLKAWELGINFFDTAELYGGGSAEKQFAKGIKALNEKGVRREDIVVTTKIFWENQGKKGQNSVGLSRKHILEGLKNSLSRLELDYVDVVYCHRFDHETPVEETVRAMDYCINKGMASYWGTSEWKASEIMEAFMYCEKYNLIKPVVEQPQYNMIVREKMESDFSRLFEKFGYGSTVWSPLLGGILTGRYNDGIPEDSRGALSQDDPLVKANLQRIFGENNKEKYTNMLKGLGKIAKELGCTQAQLAMAWVLQYKYVSCAITGCSSEKQLVDTVGAIEIKNKLTKEILEQIELLLESRPASGFNMKTFQPLPNMR